MSTGQASYRAATPPLPPAAVVVGVGDAHMPQARQWVAHACHAAWIAPAIERVVGTSHLFVACLVNAQSKISIRLSRSRSLSVSVHRAVHLADWLTCSRIPGQLL